MPRQNCSRSAAILTILLFMSGTDQSESPPNAEAAMLENQMDSELARARASTSGPVRSHLNPVFQHEQRSGTATADAEATEVAARVAGELGAEADQDRLKIEQMVQKAEKASPGTDKTKDAEAALAQAEKDADEAIAASLDSDVAAEDALHSTGTRFLHRSANPDNATADKVRALNDESVAGKDLSELESLVERVSNDLS
jgi:hypothetical protein